MKEFVSSNGVTMIVGKRFNWQKNFTYADGTGPVFLSIFGGDMSGGHQATYEPDKKKLIIGESSYSSGPGVCFHCPTQTIAEALVVMCFAAYDYEIMPLYDKEYTPPGMEWEDYPNYDKLEV